MAEPTTTGSIGVGVLGLAITLLGPLIGPYAFILFGATLGAATNLSARDTSSGWAGVAFLVRVVLTSLFFTVPTTLAIQQATGAPVEMVMGAVAYAIGWKWDVLSTRLWPWVLERVGLARPGEGSGGGPAA